MQRTWLAPTLIGGGLSLALLALVMPWSGFSMTAFGTSAGLDVFPWGYKENAMGISASRGWYGDYAANELGAAANLARAAFLGYILGLACALLGFGLSLHRHSLDNDVAFVGMAAGIVLLTSSVLLVMGAYKAFAGQEVVDDLMVSDILEWSTGLFLAIAASLALFAGGLRMMISPAGASGRPSSGAAEPSVGPPATSGSVTARMMSVPHVVCPHCRLEVAVVTGEWPTCSGCGYGARRGP